jgi:hypothetical protein
MVHYVNMKKDPVREFPGTAPSFTFVFNYCNYPVRFKYPVPVSVTVCGLFAALSRIVKVAEQATLRFGLNVTLIVQLAPACRPRRRWDSC